jgi:hypothetical protein
LARAPVRIPGRGFCRLADQGYGKKESDGLSCSRLKNMRLLRVGEPSNGKIYTVPGKFFSALIDKQPVLI